MRLRRKTGVKERLEEMKDFVLNSPGGIKGRWREVFANDNPLQVELGAGKGSFITIMAKLNPGTNFVGLERVPDIIIDAAVKRKIMNLPNLFLLLADVEHLDSFFAEGEVDRIYLNFSDPWPKKRHEKRRLTHRLYLEKYKTILKKGGEIHLKTDNADFFEFSLLSLAEVGFSLQRITWDLHKSSCEENVMTEYEKKFAEMGKPICRCEAVSPR